MSEGMPAPTEEHKRLEKLLGRWAGPEQLSPSPWGSGGPAHGESEMSVVCDGFFVVQDYTEKKEGRVTFRGHGVFGWDSNSKEYTWYWVDSIGAPAPAPARGTWNGDKLVLKSKSSHGFGRYTFHFENDDRYRFKIENCFDGQSWVPLMEGVYTRQE